MLVRADRVTVQGHHGTVLPPTSLTVEDGELRFVHGEPGAGVTAFGLALTGRMRPTTGLVSLDGSPGAAALRRVTAVVDAPGISEPDGALPLRVVAGEELALGGQPARKADVARWLAAHDVAGLANARFDTLPPSLRIRLLSTLAAQRRGVRMLVLDTPDRHTSDVATWAEPARELAEGGLAVVVLTATAAADTLPAAPTRLGHEGDQQ
ncbi:ABC transporter ATP-binding protein [Amycolatopsis cynarae]|uniref:ABC transporter ATP-binding protein n=1 Tax=Amycolatopsis cynarae TaxID=2995223 RepID=A0ABY7AUK7_9PSEU|nr:ABC transporter ATP-binding protein [Amycolatopsis sp. HUAS 11-8]WAL63395.1 ABC transporter ATP-binding protein [Amycolatopsis sp. HUAS 11-8]